jgi:hypothetical protein
MFAIRTRKFLAECSIKSGSRKETTLTLIHTMNAAGPVLIAAGVAVQAAFWRASANDMRLDGLFTKKEEKNPATIRVRVSGVGASATAVPAKH